MKKGKRKSSDVESEEEESVEEEKSSTSKKAAREIVFGSLTQAQIVKLTGNERIGFIFSHEHEEWMRARLDVYMKECTYIDESGGVVDVAAVEKDLSNPELAVDQFHEFESDCKSGMKSPSYWVTHKNPFIRVQAAFVYSIIRTEYKLMKHRIGLLDSNNVVGELLKEQVNAIYTALYNNKKRKKLVAHSRQPGLRKRRIPNGYIIFCRELSRSNNWSKRKGSVQSLWGKLSESEKEHYQKLADLVVRSNPDVYGKQVKTLLDNEAVRVHLASISPADLKSLSELDAGVDATEFHDRVQKRLDAQCQERDDEWIEDGIVEEAERKSKEKLSTILEKKEAEDNAAAESIDEEESSSSSDEEEED